MTPTLELLQRLSKGGAQFIVIGGIACVAYGSRLATDDLDLCAPMDLPNLQKIVAAIQDLDPRFRHRSDLPVVTPDTANLRKLKNLYLTTKLGVLDVLGDVPGVGGFDLLLQDAVEMEIQGIKCKIISIDKLILAKRTAGRPKDFIAISHLEAAKKLLQPPPEPKD